MTKRMRVFVTRQIAGDALTQLEEQTDLHIWPEDSPPPREVLRKEATQADALLTMLTDRVDATIMDAAPNLKVISNYAVGYDNIDIAEATQRRIPVGNTPGVLTETSADLAFALLMAAARRLPEAERYVHSGQWTTWNPTLLLGQDIYGATLGIIGLGRIGQAVAQRAKGFNMRILYHGGSDRAAAESVGAIPATLQDLLRQSDFVSLHVPLNEKTRHLIGASELAIMKPTAILINTARGPVVDPVALAEALKKGQIGGAALDVTDPEPIQNNDPLLNLENCLIVPHIGSASVATRERMAQMAVRNLLAGLNGEQLPHCVNPQVYDA